MKINLNMRESERERQNRERLTQRVAKVTEIGEVVEEEPLLLIKSSIETTISLRLDRYCRDGVDAGIIRRTSKVPRI